MIVTCAEMKTIEARAFAEGIDAEVLMNEAGAKIADAVRQFFPRPARCLVFFGKGHNGGDALVAAQQLALAGWSVELQPAFDQAEWAALTTRKHSELAATIGTLTPRAARDCPAILLDGLLCIGASGPLREPIRAATREINRLRRESDAHIFALDIPTGLDGDTGAADPDTVIADFTLTIGCAKSGLFADGATNYVGRLAVLPLGELTQRLGPVGATDVATSANLAALLPRRRFDLQPAESQIFRVSKPSSMKFQDRTLRLRRLF